MPIPEIRVTSLGEFIDYVTPAEPDPRTGRRRDTGVYRGAADARAPLLTTLDRLGGVTPPHSKADLEEHILRNFIRYSRPYLRQQAEDDWELLMSALISDVKGLISDQKNFTPWDLFTLEGEKHPFACLLEPPSLDARIVAQAGVFTLCSSKSESFDHFVERYGMHDVLTKFVIPAKLVASIRDQLDIAGIDERRLFPDLDGVAAALRRYYM